MNKEIKINMGCGAIGHLRRPGYIGYDRQDFGQQIVDTVWNLEKHFKPESVDEIVADMFIEHFIYDDVVKILNLFWKVLKDGGLIKIEVPSVRRDRAYLFVHKSFYTKATFEDIDRQEYSEEALLKPFKVVEVIENEKGNIYCTLKKVRAYPSPNRKTLQDKD